jgi:flagellar protein FliS
MAPLPYQAYRQSQASTSSQAELVVLLYRGAVRFAAKARLHMQNGDIEGTHTGLLKAQEIVVELMLGLRPTQEQVTQDLYDASVKKDIGLVDEALKHLRELLTTWEQIALPGPRPAASDVVQIDRRC